MSASTEQGMNRVSEAWVLVTSSQSGDMTSFSQLCDRYHNVIVRYVRSRVSDRGLAEDITQETFLRALRGINAVRYEGRDIGAWFVTIARNLIYDHYKSSHYRLEFTMAEVIEPALDTRSRRAGPEEQVLDAMTRDELLACIGLLNVQQRECIQLRFLQGMSVSETARFMDLTEGAVKALQHRALRRLGQLLPAEFHRQGGDHVNGFIVNLPMIDQLSTSGR